VSTDEVCGSVSEEIAEKAADEPNHALLNPTNPYAASKAGAEMIALAYKTSYALPIVITRGNNVFGPRQHIEKLIAGTLHKLSNNEPPVIHGDGLQERNFLYVKDVAKLFVLLLDESWIDQVKAQGIFLLGSRQTYSVRQIVQACIECTKKTHITPVFTKDPRPFNDTRYISGMSYTLSQKFHQTFGEFTSLEQGLLEITNSKVVVA
jgi:dTDP-D-glucose 4,6-dehydratase